MKSQPRHSFSAEPKTVAVCSDQRRYQTTTCKKKATAWFKNGCNIPHLSPYQSLRLQTIKPLSECILNASCITNNKIPWGFNAIFNEL
jgi:hypothetical protein